MDEKTIFNGGFLTKKLPIALCYLFATTAFAQNAEEIKEIQQKTEVAKLRLFSGITQKSTLSINALKQKAQKLNIPFEGKTANGIFQLQGFNQKGRPIYYITYNAGASSATGANLLNTGGGHYELDGDGMRVFEWDGGATLVSHREFGGRAKQKDNPRTTSPHATHVAGTMIASGIDKRAKGMAPKAELHAYDWYSDLNEMSDAAANEGALLSNHSYGIPAGFVYGSYSGQPGWHWLGEDDETEDSYFGKYIDTDTSWDLVSRLAPYYLPVKAAGNPRGDGPSPGSYHFVRTAQNTWKRSNKAREVNGGADGFDCISASTTGKNILVVAAAEKMPGGYKQPSDVKVASFSAFGPTDDGRIKPDITGIGVDVFSTNSSNSSSYTVMSGTSMASPNVTGSLLLLQEHYKKLYSSFMKSATLKALAIHTANEAGPHDGPDYMFGWGLLNDFKAAQVISLRNKFSLISEEKLNNKQTITKQLVAKGTEPLVVTIAWDDAVIERKDLPQGLNNRQSVLVNDLDIRITEGTNEYFPWVLDPDHPANAAQKADNARDNVEQIVINNPEAGKTYTLKITHKGDLKDNEISGGSYTLINAASQDFSLIATGVEFDVKKDLTIKAIKLPPAKDFSNATPVEVEVANEGTESVAAGAVLKYKVINTDDNTESAEAQVSLDAVSGKSSIKKTITVDLSKSFANYTIEAEVVSTEDEITFNNKATAKAYNTIVDLTEKKSSFSYDFESPFDKKGWTAEDTDDDKKTWMIHSDRTFAHSGAQVAVNFPGHKTTNDWMFSNPFQVKPNTLYSLEFYAAKLDQNKKESLEVFIGNDATSTAMLTKLDNSAAEDLTNSYAKYYYEFRTPNTADKLFIGFHHKSDTDSYAVAVDDVVLRHADGEPVVAFKADRVKANSYEVITLNNETFSAAQQPVTSYEWSFSPNKVAYQDNTNAHSKTPKVLLTENGLYTVTLKATNSEGTGSLTKDSYISIQNTPVVASFTETATKIGEGETITFKNTSTGNPVPTKFNWVITPSENVEFTSGTSATSENIIVKFNKYGKYSVALTAESSHNADTKEKAKLINVTTLYQGVGQVNHSLDTAAKTLTLNWERPFMRPDYNEDFEGATVPVDMTVIDANQDGKTWGLSTNYKSTGKKGIAVYFARNNKVADDWLITPMQKAGAEELAFDYFHQYKERYDVYLIEATQGGTVPSVDEIKANGHKIYTEEATTGKMSKFATKAIDIKPHTAKDFFIAFHYRSLPKESYAIALDNIQVGYNNAGKTDRKADKSTEEIKDYKAIYEAGKELINITAIEQITPVGKEEIPVKEFGFTTEPKLKGYEIHRNGVKLSDISDVNTLSFVDHLTDNGTYTYDVYALYEENSGTVKSDKESTTVVVTNLSTSEAAKASTLKIYPNPSNGHFTIDAGTGTSHIKAEVYDMAGKLVFKGEYKSAQAELNLTSFPKGAYLLTVLNDRGEKQTAKLIIK